MALRKRIAVAAISAVAICVQMTPWSIGMLGFASAQVDDTAGISQETTTTSAPVDPRIEAQAALDKAEKQANAAAEKYSVGLAEFYGLSNQIDEVQAQVDALEVRVSHLHSVLGQRAVEMYMGGPDPSTAFTILEAQSLIDASRRSRLAASVSRHDNELIDSLSALHGELEVTREGLENQRRELKTKVEKLGKDASRLDQLFTEAAAALKILEEVALASELPAVGLPGTDLTSTTRPPSTTPVEIPRPTSAQPISDTGLLCPIQAPVAFTDDWGDPRSDGRFHEGNDIYAARDTANVAVIGGMIRHTTGGAGGTALFLDGDDGTSYYYAHLDAWVGGEGRVERGDLIGLTGNTGNALGGPFHTHFEMHPNGGGPINPFPIISAACTDFAGVPGGSTE